MQWAVRQALANGRLTIAAPKFGVRQQEFPDHSIISEITEN
jgi:hypothetical protein